MSFTPAMLRFRSAYSGLAESLGRAPAKCEVADALGVSRQAAERTIDKLRLAGAELAFSIADGGRVIRRAVPLAQGAA
jgi:biotin operon repressor